MSELEKKFYEYFMSEYFNPKEPEKIAKELAKIAEKEYDGLPHRLWEACQTIADYRARIHNFIDKEDKLEKENIELKKQNKLMNCTINEMGYEIECHKKQIEDNK